MVPCVLDLSYYILTKTVVSDEAIAAIILEFVAKVIDNENEYLQHHAICLIDNLESLQFLYLIKHNVTSIAPIIKSLEQACTISE